MKISSARWSNNLQFESIVWVFTIANHQLSGWPNLVRNQNTGDLHPQCVYCHETATVRLCKSVLTCLMTKWFIHYWFAGICGKQIVTPIHHFQTSDSSFLEAIEFVPAKEKLNRKNRCSAHTGLSCRATLQVFVLGAVYSWDLNIEHTVPHYCSRTRQCSFEQS